MMIIQAPPLPPYDPGYLRAGWAPQAWVYRITNTVNGKVYIGSTVDIDRRFRDHRSSLRANRHSNKHLQAAWWKYGEDSFRFDVVRELGFDTKDLVLANEQIYLDLYASYKRENGYNDNPVAGSSIGYRYTTEQRAHLSLVQKVVQRRPEVVAAKRLRMSGENGPMYGKNSEDFMSPEAIVEKRRKQSEHIGPALRASACFADHLRRLPGTLRGKKRTPEQRAYIAEQTRKAMKRPDIEAKMYGPKSEQAKHNMHLGHLGKPLSREHVEAQNRGKHQRSIRLMLENWC
jgi:group I intron endonuclease